MVQCIIDKLVDNCKCLTIVPSTHALQAVDNGPLQLLLGDLGFIPMALSPMHPISIGLIAKKFKFISYSPV